MDNTRNRGHAPLRSLPALLGAFWSCILAGGSESPAQDRPAARAEAVAERLAWEIESRKSVEVRTTYQIVPAKVDPQQPQEYDTIEDHYIEATGGRRSCESRFFKSGVGVQRIDRFSDGSKCADVNYIRGDPDHQQSAVIKREYAMEDRSQRMEIPEPLTRLYVGREPLSRAVRKAADLGEGQALGRQCDLFLFVNVRWEVPQDHVYYLDRATCMPLRVESYKNQAAREAKKPIWVWTAESLDQVQGHFIPLRLKMVAFNEDSTPLMTWLYRVQSIEFDKDFPPATFWPDLEPGVSVLDTLSGKSYRVPGSDGKIPEVKPKAVNTSQPIEATVPRGWSPMIAGTILVLGAAVLVAGIVLWRRQ